MLQQCAGNSALQGNEAEQDFDLTFSIEQDERGGISVKG